MNQNVVFRLVIVLAEAYERDDKHPSPLALVFEITNDDRQASNFCHKVRSSWLNR